MFSCYVRWPSFCVNIGGLIFVAFERSLQTSAKMGRSGSRDQPLIGAPNDYFF